MGLVNSTYSTLMEKLYLNLQLDTNGVKISVTEREGKHVVGGISPCCLVTAKRNSSIFSLLNNIKKTLGNFLRQHIILYVDIYM
jgi:hypothetical protein